MSDQFNEKISAFLDDELELSEMEGIRKKFEQDSDVQLRLNRYALISESLKGNHNVSDAQKVAEQVRKRLINEPTILTPTRPNKTNPVDNWKTYFAGAAVAATVAAVAVFNFSSLTQPDLPSEQFPVTVSVSPVVKPFMAENLSLPASTKWTTQENQSEEIERELNQLLMEHSEYTTQSGIPGMLPYATIVVYDKKK